ncbi:putative sulfate exporter family transporter [Chryseobacterium indologenes]|uniref:YeiH family protein n=1 Tax=Chryseobacterium TaxID=59732 RepID=UPI00047F27C7|nr:MULTISPECIES: putative sulfate exporter family transporter [Chryseobacterium]AYZ36508.1 putative sulfate exporter family transporter [Chryseobacterium indologenes]MBF6645193.1 putative sulfate exporter family transporter [Chryseobacterium indologenes]MBU3048084.1 putative sulfate exporter family transporter [Chryseobacterium indologenes]MEB4759469.1 putative sulfate exporter family transporter [Chryseobacterium indologenes]QQQ71135.1 putative sulfate exporter family transporter [Chryseobact
MKDLIQNEVVRKAVFIILAILCLTPFISSPIALVLGFGLAVFIGNPFEKHLHQYIHLLLQISIVGLGFGLKLDEALHAGKTGLMLTVVSIVSVMLLGFILGKVFKLERPLSYLLSAGTAICGGSAIAAVSPIIKPSTKQISLALAIVFTLNSIALFIYPAIGHLLNLSQEQFGLWCAVGIHDTSSVVGAAGKYGDEALKVATTVKLARALWIIPVSLITMFIFKNKESKVKIPWFIGYFIVAILLNTYFPVLDAFSTSITAVAKSGLNLTLFFIGSTLSIQTLKTIGCKPLLTAVLLWVSISIGSLLYIIH